MIVAIVLYLVFGIRFVVSQQTCQLVLPDNPLTAQGLATPFRLRGCSQAIKDQQVFVQGGVITPDGGVFVYNPLVVTDGQPFVKPVVPKIPKNSVIALWFGTNADTLQLVGCKDNCVNGLDNPRSLFGQFAYCNAEEFFKKADQIKSPNLGMALDGLPCPTTLSFSVVDQDPNDNVNTIYLMNANGVIMQDTQQNRNNNPDAIELINASDEGLLARSLANALKCLPFMAPDLGDNNKLKPALFLNEISARQHQLPPKAFLPANDPMVLVNGQPNIKKLNLYRVGVFQDPVNNLNQASTALFCRGLVNDGVPRLAKQKQLFVKQPSPADTANNLFTFMALRFNTTWGAVDGLDCTGLTNIANPVKLVLDNNGIVVDASYNIKKIRS